MNLIAPESLEHFCKSKSKLSWIKRKIQVVTTYKNSNFKWTAIKKVEIEHSPAPNTTLSYTLNSKTKSVIQLIVPSFSNIYLNEKYGSPY